MNSLFTLIVVIQVLAALTIIGLVLLQHGKGADMGAAFGSGASGSLFGATGSSNFLSKSTGIAAAVFFASTLALSFMVNKRSTGGGAGVMENLPAASVPVGQAASVPGVAASVPVGAASVPPGVAVTATVTPASVPPGVAVSATVTPASVPAASASASAKAASAASGQANQIPK